MRHDSKLKPVVLPREEHAWLQGYVKPLGISMSQALTFLCRHERRECWLLNTVGEETTLRLEGGSHGI